MSLDTFIGQSRVKRQVAIIIQQAKQEKMPHLGVFGKAGMGKTMLSHIIADETEAKLIYMNGTSVNDPITFLTEVYKAKDNPQKAYVVFIDEAANLPKKIQENLLSVLEEPSMLCIVAPKTMQFKKGDQVETVRKGQSVQVKVPANISFILGTTHKGKLSNAILSRVVSIDLDDYEEEDCIAILKMASKRQLPEKAYAELARIGKNNRLMKQHLKSFEAFLDLCALGDSEVGPSHFREFCDINGIGEDGCDKTDVKYMKLLHKHGKIGLKSMAAMLQVPVNDIENIIEPWLMEKEYIRITPRGRELTDEGMKRIGQTAIKDVDNLFEIGD